VLVHFESPNGYEATVSLPRHQVVPTKGDHPTADAGSPEVSVCVPFSTLDAYAFARILNGRDPGGLVARIGDPLRGVAAALLASPTEQRQGTLLATLRVLMPDNEVGAFVEAVSSVDPDGPEPEDQADPEPPGPVLVCLSDVDPQEVQWLWANRIPLGKVTVLAGDPGLGKSFVTISIAATVSSGGSWPDSVGECVEAAPVIVMSGEDDLADTIRPRLDAAGAEVSRVHALTTIRQPDGSLSPFNLESDLPQLEEALRTVEGTRLVIIDPVSAFYGATDDCRNSEVRGLMAPLAELAARHRVAVLLVTHLNKSGMGKALYRFTGSLGLIAAARAGWLIVRDKDDPARRLMLSVKCNLAPDPSGLAYRIAEGRVEWESGRIDTTADEALSAERERAERSPSDLDRAAAWLRDYLADGDKPSEETHQLGNAALGLKRPLKWWRDSVLKDRLGGKPRKDGFTGGWVWSLPREDSQESEESQESRANGDGTPQILQLPGLTDPQESGPDPGPDGRVSSDSSASSDSSTPCVGGGEAG
jgi:hypothetical protein